LYNQHNHLKDIHIKTTRTSQVNLYTDTDHVTTFDNAVHT